MTDRYQEVAGALTELMPVDAADRLAAHLTVGDVVTLRDLVRAAVPDNTTRAVASDLAYLEAWARAATGDALSWPPSEADGLKFIASTFLACFSVRAFVGFMHKPAAITREMLLPVAGSIKGSFSAALVNVD